jgi:hypothetical protein
MKMPKMPMTLTTPMPQVGVEVVVVEEEPLKDRP